MIESTKKVIIFDLDGTLSDTAQATVVSLNEAGKQYGIHEVTEKAVRSVMGFADPEFFYHLYPQYPRKLLNKMRYKVNDLEDRIVKKLGEKILFPGIKELLTDLNEKGHHLYIASTGSTLHVQTTLQASAIEGLFKGVSCNESIKVNMVKNIVKRYNKDECLAVGDMIKDSEAARSNGILALGAAYGYLNKENHTLFDAILYTPNELYEYL